MEEAEQQVAIAPPRPSGWFARLRAGSPAPAPIAKEQLEELLTRARAASVGAKVFAHVWTMIDKMADAETARLARIEDKAKSLLTAAGASLSFTLTFGVKALMEQQSVVVSAPWWIRLALYGSAVLAVVASVLANVMAVWAITVGTSYRTFNLADVLNQAGFEWVGKADGDDPKVARYQEYLLPQAATIVQERFAANEAKADLVKAGQRAFVAYLGLLVIAAALVAVLALSAR